MDGIPHCEAEWRSSGTGHVMNVSEVLRQIFQELRGFHRKRKQALIKDTCSQSIYAKGL